MRKRMLLGRPGTGKTEKLLRIIENALEAGVRPTRVALVAFTKAAIEVAKARACAAFGLTPDELPHFRTVHSFAFRELGLRRDDVLTDTHLERVAEVTGELLSTLENPFSDAPAAGKQADPLLTLDHFARTTGLGLEAAWRAHGGDVEWFRLLRFSQAYSAYKEDEGVLDFTDMLTKYAELPLSPIDLDLAVVDEAQDLSRAQWRVVDKAFSRAGELVVAGDDMQMVHHWAGADEEKFLGLEAEGFEVEVLPLSYRLGRLPFELAEEVGNRIERRYRRTWRPSGREGSVDWVSAADDVDLASGGPGGPGKPLPWLLLARTRSQLPGLAAAARGQGVVYELKGKKSVDWADVVAIRAHEALRAGRRIGTDDVSALAKAAGRPFEAFDGERTAAELGWDARPIWHDALTGIAVEDREYYLAILRRGGKLTDDARVRVETIHGAKGMESEGVVLSTDMTYKTSKGMEIFPDGEHRVFFVGLTRVMDRMFLVEPRTQYGYRI
jgi:superfamily I DNA/RNA helicase